MIQHKVLIAMERESMAQESCSFAEESKIKNRASTQWQIMIIGDIEQDDPSQACKLLNELQIQVNKIRSAYQ